VHGSPFNSRDIVLLSNTGGTLSSARKRGTSVVRSQKGSPAMPCFSGLGFLAQQ